MQTETTTRNMMKPTTRCSSRKVRFQEELRVFLVEPPTEEQRSIRWYSPADLQTEDSTEFSLEEGRQLKELRHHFVNSLLAQQYENQQMGVYDPKGLFQLSLAGSKYSKKRAMKTANEQAEEAKEIFREETIGILDCVLAMLDYRDF